MKTWFCKDTQKWTSELPRAFWTGEYDYITGEKIYSDEVWVYCTNDDYDWFDHQGIECYKDVRNYKDYKNYGILPYTHIYGRGLYKKIICKKLNNI